MVVPVKPVTNYKLSFSPKILGVDVAKQVSVLYWAALTALPAKLADVAHHEPISQCQLVCTARGPTLLSR